jgi:hypothetical protein
MEISKWLSKIIFIILARGFMMQIFYWSFLLEAIKKLGKP